jgi:multiple sugar transport system substrate-binding protein
MRDDPRKFRIAVRKFGPFESAIEKQWAAFEQAERSGLELEAVPMDLHPLLASTFENDGLKRGDWDVAFLNTDWVANAHATGAVLDLAPRIKAHPPADYPDGWSPSMLRLQQVDGQVLGLPYHDGPECLIYRRDLFDDPAEQAAFERQFGTPLRVPETWDEFHRAARFFHRPERGLSGTLYAAFPDGHNTVYDFCLQLWTRGGELMDTAGRVCLNTPQAVAALEFLRLMVNDKSAVHPACREMDSVKSGLAFAAGEAALMVNWFGFAAMAQTVDDSRVKDKVSVAQVPHGPGAAGSSLNIYWFLSIAAGSPHADVAWRFLRHCATPEMDKLLTLEGAIGCRKSTWTDADVNRIIPFYRHMEDLHANAREMPRLVAWPRIAEVIDRMVLAAIDTDAPAGAIATRAQSELAALDAVAGAP